MAIEVSADVERLDYATWRSRAVAWILDCIVVAGLWCVISPAVDVALWPLSHHFHDWAPPSLYFGLPRSGWGWIFGFLYWVLLVKFDGATVGMASVSRVRVEDDATEALPTWWQSVTRFVVMFIFALAARFGFPGLLVGLIFFLLDYVVFPLNDKGRRTLHDIAAHTVVRQLPKRSAGETSATHPPGRRLVVRAGLALVVLMLIVGGVTSWVHRQPNPNSAWGVATQLATVAERSASLQGTPVTTHDVLRAPLLGAIESKVAFSMHAVSPREVEVTVGKRSACVFLRGRPDVTPTVRRCPFGTI